MSSLGHGGPPERISPPPELDLSYSDISQGQQIGSGATSVVQKVEIKSNGLCQTVAIKQPNPNGTLRKETAARFIEEAKIWDNLTSVEPDPDPDELPARDHIVSIVDWGDGPVPWIAMEYMDNGNLRDLLDEADGPLPLEQALWLAYCVCRAVRHAHLHGVVHHDIKPENVLLQQTNDGWPVPKVSDWGLAKVMLDADEGAKGLTTVYAAPEQLAPDEFGSADWTTDVYQIGALTYELVTGQQLFDGFPAEITELKISKTPPRPSTIANVPEAVDDAIMPALRTSKRNRYDSIDYLRDELLGLFEIHYGTNETAVRQTVRHEPRFETTADEDTGIGDSKFQSEKTAEADDAEKNTSEATEKSVLDHETDGQPSWNEYRRELEERQRSFWFSLFPGRLRRLFYRDLVTEVEQAEERRERTRSNVETVRSRARKLREQLQEELREARRRGKPLPEPALECIGPLEDTVARIKGLRDDQVEYLRSDEQATLNSLHEELAELKAYVDAKRELDREVDEIASALEETEAEINERIDADRLLTDEAERELLEELSDASRWIRTARRELTTEPLTEQDIERFDDLIEREKSLRRQVTNHNDEIVQQQFDSRIDDVTTVRDKLVPKIEVAKRTGKPLPQSHNDYLEAVLPRLEAVKDLLDPPKGNHLSDEQGTTLEELRADLARIKVYVEARKALDGELTDLKIKIRDIQEEVANALDIERLLTEREERILLEQIDDVNDRIETTITEFESGPLTEYDLTRLEAPHDHVSALRRKVTSHNEDHAQRVFSARIKASSSVRDSIETELQDSREDGELLPKPPESYFTEIDPQLDGLEKLLTSRTAEFLSEDQLEDLETLRTDLKTVRAFVRTKARFEAHIETVRATANDLESSRSELLDGERYLTTPDRNRLLREVEQLQSAVSDLAAEVLFDRLSATDRGRFSKYVDLVERTQRDVRQYNDQFLSQERDRFTEAFSQHLDESQVLNEHQELAIYRNDVHNQVIAGAGTGKTLSLVFRIKYLLEKGIPPEDILALTFNGEASRELEQRLEELFGVTSVDCRTFHSFGRTILGRVDPNTIVIEGESRLREVERVITDHRDTDDQFCHHHEQFMEQYEAAKLSSDAKVRKKFCNSLDYSSGVTLRGETVDSNFNEVQEAHVSIADFLFKRGISYRYCQYADWADTPGGDAYIPIFTLPDHDLCIEYLPSKQVRQRQKRYKRKRSSTAISELFENTNRRVVTISGDAISVGNVEKLLKYYLDDVDVPYDSPLRGRKLHDQVYEYAILEREIIELYADFIKKARTNQVDLAPRLEELDADEDPLLFHFSHAAARLVESYTDRYREYNAADYVDMIMRSTAVMWEGKADRVVDFRHVLVDEFQDLNLAQIQFVQAILSRNERSHLFAVGDDWQSIYGFKSARPDYFVDFSKYFEPAVDTHLEINYRCPPSIVEAGNQLIENNDIWTEKVVVADKSVDTTPTVHLVPGTDDFQYESNAITKIGRLVQDSIEKDGRSPAEIMVLARNEEGSPFIRRISKLLESADIPVGGSDGVNVRTAHQSKGREAEHVIIANAVSGEKDGFPSMDENRNLTEIAEMADDSTMDEERRLFYMALTRTKERLDIQTRATQQSPFLDEISEHVHERPVLVDCEQDRETITVTVDSTAQRDIWRSRQIGTLVLEPGYKLNFAIPESATDVPLLEEGEEYQLKDVRVGEYNERPQFKIDNETAIKVRSTSSPE